jgi:hypothetical protein
MVRFSQLAKKRGGSDKGRAAKALQEEVRANVMNEIGRIHFDRAEQEERNGSGICIGGCSRLGYCGNRSASRGDRLASCRYR